MWRGGGCTGKVKGPDFTCVTEPKSSSPPPPIEGRTQADQLTGLLQCGLRGTGKTVFKI